MRKRDGQQPVKLIEMSGVDCEVVHTHRTCRKRLSCTLVLNDIIRANEDSFVPASVCGAVGTHQHHMTPADRWRMDQSLSPDATMSMSL